MIHLTCAKESNYHALAKSGWSSVHSVIEDDSFWDVIDKLKDAGAEGIIVCPIEKMVLITDFTNPERKKWLEITKRPELDLRK